LALLGLTLSGCATKGDLRDLRTEVRELAAQQREALSQITGMNLAVQDTLRGQSDQLFESRGDIVRLLRELEQELLTLQELTGQNQRALATIRDLLEAQGAGGVNPTRSDRSPGQIVNPDLTLNQPRTSTAVEMYNVAATHFNRGNIGTARMAFRDFLQAYPNDALAPDAHFFLADIMVQEERYEEAIQGFLRVHELFPTADRVPRALYRVGTTYLELGQVDDARVYFERVVNTYPDTDAAALAQDRLDEIG
jgi:tol-pal system protein YbgF